MTLPIRKGYKGAPAQAVLTNSPTSSDTSFVVDTVVGWATTFPFYCVVDSGKSTEEKVKVTAISGSTLTVVRAQDDTSSSGHSSGASIYPVFTADEADEANQIASVMTTKGDLIATDGSSINRLGIGTDTYVLQADAASTNGVKWGQVVAGGIATGAVTSAKILDNTIVLGDLATALQAFLVPVGSINAYAGATAPTGWLLCDGTSTTGYTALAALVGATTPDMRGRFPIGDNSTLTLLGTGGSATISEANLPVHKHANTATASTSVTVDAGGSHYHTGTSDGGGGHGHTASSADAGSHGHALQATTFATAVSHAHNNISDYASAGTNGQGTVGGGIPNAISAAGTHSHTITVDAVGNHTHTFTTSTIGNHGHTASGTTTVTMTNANTGSGTDYYQPYLVVNYIIKHD